MGVNPTENPEWNPEGSLPSAQLLLLDSTSETEGVLTIGQPRISTHFALACAQDRTLQTTVLRDRRVSLILGKESILVV